MKDFKKLWAGIGAIAVGLLITIQVTIAMYSGLADVIKNPFSIAVPSGITMLQTGNSLRQAFIKLAGNNSNVKHVVWNAAKPADGVTTSEIQTDDSAKKVLAYYDDNTIYVYSDAWTDWSPDDGSEAPVYMNPDSSRMFGRGADSGGSSLNNVESIANFNELNASKVKTLAYMFYECNGASSSLDIDFSGWDLSCCTDVSCMFTDCTNVKTIKANFGDSFKNVQNMNGMFSNCAYVTSIEGIDDWNTSSLTSANDIFQDCRKLKSMDLSGWDVSKLTTLECMFRNCNSLTSIGNISKWDVSNVTNMEKTFEACNSLTSINLSNWNTSKVTKMDYMFSGCGSLQTVNLDNWDLTACKDIGLMFCYAGASGTSIDLSSWKNVGSNVSLDAHDMFQNARFGEINLNGWNMSKTTDVSGMFAGPEYYARSTVSPLAKVGVSDWDMSSVNYMDNMFQYAGISGLDLNSWKNVGSKTSLRTTSMFDGCSNLVSVDLSTWDCSQLTSTEAMFRNCTLLTSFDTSTIKNWNTENLTNTSSMFSGCSALTKLDLSNLNVSKVTNMSRMFEDSMRHMPGNIINLTKWNTSAVTNMSGMFCGSNVERIYVSDSFTVDNVTSDSNMFGYQYSGYCLYLVGCNGTVWNKNHRDKSYAHIDNSPSDPGYFWKAKDENTAVLMTGANFNSAIVALAGGASNIKSISFVSSKPDTTTYTSSTSVASKGNIDAYYNPTDESIAIYCPDAGHTYYVNADSSNMFNGLNDITSIDFDKYFDTDTVTNMASMFSGCSALTSIDLSTFDTSAVADMSSMFKDCSSLSLLNLNNFNTSAVTTMANMFDGCSNIKLIYVSDEFNTDNLGDSDETTMFLGCTSIVGGNGTVYDASNVGKAYAVIDSTSKPGYFTLYDPNFLLYTFTLNNDDTVTLSKYSGSTEEVNIPSKVPVGLDYVDSNGNSLDDKIISKIGSNAFDGNKSLAKVNLSENLTSIGSEAFKNCTKLTTINFSSEKNLTAIDRNAFYSCNSLTSISLPEGLTSLGSGVFGDCTKLRTVNIPATLGNSLTSCNYNDPFRGCSSLSNVTFGSDIKYIPNNLFAQSGLQEITIPDTVTKIGSEAFKNCIKLTTITILNDNLFAIDNNAFDGDSKLTTIYCNATSSQHKSGENGYAPSIYKGCTSLVAGTVSYNSSNISSVYSTTYENGGYFTPITSSAKKATLTFDTDGGAISFDD